VSDYSNLWGILTDVRAHHDGGALAVLVHPEVHLQIKVPADLYDRTVVHNGAPVVVDGDGPDSETLRVTRIEADR
jgi:hypothetical protein